MMRSSLMLGAAAALMGLGAPASASVSLPTFGGSSGAMPGRSSGFRQGRRHNYGRPIYGRSMSWNGLRNGDNPAGTKLAKKIEKGQLGLARLR